MTCSLSSRALPASEARLCPYTERLGIARARANLIGLTSSLLDPAYNKAAF